MVACAVCAYVGASVGAGLGFMLAAMLHVASDADDQTERYLRNLNDGEH